MKTLTFIYSSQSIETLQELFTELINVFGYTVIPKLDEMFYYGVFCKENTYSNYKHWNEAPDDLEIPEILTAVCAKPSERLNYVRSIINEIIRGEIEKPEWMKYVEEEETCNIYDAAPSTFLYLIPKDEKYQELANKLLGFLYSPNMMVTEVR